MHAEMVARDHEARGGGVLHEAGATRMGMGRRAVVFKTTSFQPLALKARVAKSNVETHRL